MNGNQISHLLSMDRSTGGIFKGFAMRDSSTLPFPNQTPALYFLNTDVESGPGEHWCAVFFDCKKGQEFFDPFGMPPNMYGFDSLLSKRSTSVASYNRMCVQDSTSKTCGHHCLFYAFHRCRGFLLKDILKYYSEQNLKGNDDLAVNFVVQFGKSYYPMR